MSSSVRGQPLWVDMEWENGVVLGSDVAQVTERFRSSELRLLLIPRGSGSQAHKALCGLENLACLVRIWGSYRGSAAPPGSL